MKVTIPKPVPINIGPAKVYKFASQTRPGWFHYVMVLEKNPITCSCDGFQYAGHCWHIDNITFDHLRPDT